MAAVLGALGVVMSAAPSASAGPLTADYCRELLGQRKALEAEGVAGHVERGPEWAKTNLTPQQIGDIGAFIVLEEQIKFQCPLGFDNVVVAQIKGTARSQPPVPGSPGADIRVAKAAARRQPRKEARRGVPLPVRNTDRPERPAQGAAVVKPQRTPELRGTSARSRPPAPRPRVTQQQTQPLPSRPNWATDVFNN
ncbi:MAG: hypothetical protein AAFQ45_02695 [Pseudomonadota bacterium]